MKIKCTYEKCFKHFESHRSMIIHKEKDPNHYYCKLCDVDCEDDMHLFIHQLGTPAHICCPVCAQEFKSTAGRDRHVEQNHRAGQRLSCAGCNGKFISAATLMSHIENDECSVIRLTDFQMQRAEKQLSKDTWVKETEPYSITSPSEERTNVTVKSILDDGPRRERSLSNALGGPISAVSHEHFPALGAKAAVNPNVDTKSQANTNNLINFDDPVKDMARLNISQPPLQARQGNVWNARNEPGPDEFENALGLRGWLNSVNSTTNPPSDNHSEVASLYNRRVPESVVSSNFIPPSVRAADPNSAANFKRLITMPAHSIISSTNRLEFERFWDSLRQEYVCPGEKCHRGFKTRLDFQKHLLSSSHVGGSVTCPSCLKKFATTTAWVAHCESASKKCDIRNSADFNNVMREVTGGVLGTSGFLDDGTVKYVAPEIQEW